jgi:hypothetical protein
MDTPHDRIDRRIALKGRFLARFGAAVIAAAQPDPATTMRVGSAVLDGRSRTLETLPQD